jgi:hypothetical protein
MSGYFFDRVARLTLGIPNMTGGITGGIGIQTPARIVFELTKTPNSIANIGTITVNNLDKHTRESIHASKSGDPFIAVLEAGYTDAGGPQLLFYGDVVDVSHNIEKPEVVTTITVMDGYNVIKEKKISVSYKKGTPISKVIKDCVQHLGLPVNVSFKYILLPQQNSEHTLSFTGNAATWLDRLCDDHGLQWSVQDGSIKVCSVTQTDNVPPMSSVLIGSPKRLFKNMASQSPLEFNGYEFNCLLAPKMGIYSRVTIQSGEIPTPVTLKVMEIKHSGDTHGDAWKTNCKAQDL